MISDTSCPTNPRPPFLLQCFIDMLQTPGSWSHQPSHLMPEIWKFIWFFSPYGQMYICHTEYNMSVFIVSTFPTCTNYQSIIFIFPLEYWQIRWYESFWTDISTLNGANHYKERRSIGATTVTLNAALQTCRHHWEIVPYQRVEGWLLDLHPHQWEWSIWNSLLNNVLILVLTVTGYYFRLVH